MSEDAGVRELIPGKLFALGTAFENNGRVTWIPSEAVGYQAANCYLVREDGMDVLIDPGPAFQGEALRDQLASILPRGTGLQLFLTRAEFDSFGALKDVAAWFPIEAILSGGNINPFDSFGHVGSVSGVEVKGKAEMVRVPSGDTIALSDKRGFRIIDPVLRLLATYWAYDERYRTLFCSDVFTHLLGATPQEALQPARQASVDAKTLLAHLSAKHWWLPEANVEPIRVQLREIFEDQDVEYLCPSYGRPIVGREAMAETYEVMMECLDLIERQLQP